MLVSHSAAKKRDINSQFREMLMIDALARVQKMDKNDFIKTVGMLNYILPLTAICLSFKMDLLVVRCRYLYTQIIYTYLLYKHQ